MFYTIYRALVQPVLDRVFPPDAFELQARIDQESATHPGCIEGDMECCRFCGLECVEGVPSRRFVAARAAMLRRGETDDPDGGSSFTLANIQAGVFPPLPKL